MKAEDVMHHFQKVGTWVRWPRTCDLFMHGDPEIEVKGIATGWIATDKAIEEAGAKVPEKVKPLGQDTVLICGDRTKKVSRMAVGTGAITFMPAMMNLEADLVLATDAIVQAVRTRVTDFLETPDRCQGHGAPM